MSANQHLPSGKYLIQVIDYNHNCGIMWSINGLNLSPEDAAVPTGCWSSTAKWPSIYGFKGLNWLLCPVRRSLGSPRQRRLCFVSGVKAELLWPQPKGAYSKLSFWGAEPKRAANAGVSYITKALWGWHSLRVRCIMGVGTLDHFTFFTLVPWQWINWSSCISASIYTTNTCCLHAPLNWVARDKLLKSWVLTPQGHNMLQNLPFLDYITEAL